MSERLSACGNYTVYSHPESRGERAELIEKTEREIVERRERQGEGWRRERADEQLVTMEMA